MSPSKRQPVPAGHVREMFGEIAGTYDLVNRLMTFGRDRVWRQCALRAAGLSPNSLLLDAGTGTGGIALDALAGEKNLRVVGADFTPAMMLAGRRRAGGRRITWIAADALSLPFKDASFDAVTSGYLIRNVADAARAFREQARAVKPGGRVVCLETSPPPEGPLKLWLQFFLNRGIPWLGGIVSGNRAAYTYLPRTTQAFYAPQKVCAIMRAAGLVDIRFQRFMFGTIAVHVGMRPHQTT